MLRRAGRCAWNVEYRRSWDPRRRRARARRRRPRFRSTLLPPDFTGESTGAEIAVSTAGRFVYCSNRGHDGVAIFAADPGTGALTAVGWTSSRGRIPRFIGFEPAKRFLYAANEQGDSIVCWSGDPQTGRQSRGDRLSINGV